MIDMILYDACRFYQSAGSKEGRCLLPVSVVKCRYGAVVVYQLRSLASMLVTWKFWV